MAIRKMMAIGVVLALVLVACSGSTSSPDTAGEPGGAATTMPEGTDAAPDSTDPSSETTQPGDADGAAADVVRLGVVGDIASLEPFRMAVGNFGFFGSILDPLIVSEKGGELTGGALESWEMSDDNTSITMVLREGLTTHAGTPVTSEMLVANLERIQDPNLGAALYNQLAPLVEDHEVIDDLTLRLDLVAPSPHLPSLLTKWAVADPAMFIAEDGTVHNANEETDIIGTGPYRLVEYRPNESMVFEAFEDYRDPNLPLTPRVEVSMYGDANGLVLALEAGEVDIAFNIPYDSAAEFANNDQIEVVGSENPPMYYVLLMSPEADGLGDERFRQAIDAAIDRESLNQAAFAGTGRAVRECFPPTSAAHLGEPLGPDVEKAEQLLAEVGVPEQSFSIAVASNNPTLITMAEVITADLGSVGIQTTVEPMEISVWNEARAEANYELYISFGNGPLTHPARIADFGMAKVDDNLLFDEAGPQPAFEEYQAAFRSALEAGSESEAEDQWQAMNQAMLDGAWLNCLVSASLVTATRSNVEGYSFADNEIPYLHEVVVHEE